MKNRCVIISAYNATSVKNSVDLSDNDFIICADGGYLLAAEENITPDLVIGDLDSVKKQCCRIECPVIRLPVQKDDTDTLACIKYAIDNGFKDIVIAGGIGGRFDHSFACVQSLYYAQTHGADIILQDGENTLFFIIDSSKSIPARKNKKLSVFSYTEHCCGVTLKGVQYPLNNAELSQSFPIGVSNEFISDTAEISVKHGALLIVLSDNL